MTKTALFFDIDGTIWDNDHPSISDRLIQTLNRLEKNKFSIYINTGRSLHSIPSQVIEPINWDGYICNNGARILDHSKQEIFCATFTEENYREITTIAREKNICLEVKTRDARNLNQAPNAFQVQAQKFFGGDSPKIHSIDHIHYKEVIGFIIYGDTEIQNYFSNISGVRLLPGKANYADIVVNEIDKTTGIKFVSNNEPIQQTISFGDSLNDLDMIRFADIGVVVENSVHELKQIADEIVPCVSENGVGRFIEERLLSNSSN
ncbi:HAD-IIB family hydrolase [Enterococcus avium]|uniref:HAD-IIB family hydrolase n=1 Tax=Enterococcus avium TaxID=33945 RepID=UPI003DA42B0A